MGAFGEICGALPDLVPFVQFKKRDKVADNFTKINTPAWVFFTFFKLYKWYQIAQRIIFNEEKGICFRQKSK